MATNEELEVGTRVMVKGLKAAAQYNGQLGQVQGPLDEGRYPIYVNNLQKSLRIKRDNFDVLESDTQLETSTDAQHVAQPLQDETDEKSLVSPDTIVVEGCGCEAANCAYGKCDEGHAGKPRWTSKDLPAGWEEKTSDLVQELKDGGKVMAGGKYYAHTSGKTRKTRPGLWSLEWTELDGGTWWLCDDVIGRYAALSELDVPPPSGWETVRHHSSSNNDKRVNKNDVCSLPEWSGVSPEPRLSYPGSQHVTPALPRPAAPASWTVHKNKMSSNTTSRRGKANKKAAQNGKASSKPQRMQSKRDDSPKGAPSIKGQRGPSETKTKGKKRLKLEKKLKGALDRGGHDVSDFDERYGELSLRVLEAHLKLAKDGDFAFHLTGSPGGRKAD